MGNESEAQKRRRQEEEGGIGIGTGILIGVGALIAGVLGKAIYDEVTKKEEKEIEQKEIEQKEIEHFYKEKTITNETNSTLDSFICPITQEIMNDPVITPDGISYEKNAILKWLKNNHYDPLTKKPLNNNSLIPNYALKNAISDYKNKQAQISKQTVNSSK